jgi:hypothetical protein
MLKTLQLLFLFTLLFSLISISATKAQTDWEFDASLYMWFSAMDATVGIANEEAQLEATPSDILANIEFAFPVHFEVRNPDVSLIADIMYLGVGQDVDVQVTTPRNTIANTGEMDFDLWVVEGAFGYRFSKQFEILFSLRYYDIQVSMLVDENTTSQNQDWYDGYLGARYKTDFAKDWYTTIRGEIGTGGSNFAWYGNAEVGYRFSQLFSMSAAYRALSVDYETGSGINYFKFDALCHGFAIAAIFSL